MIRAHSHTIRILDLQHFYNIYKIYNIFI